MMPPSPLFSPNSTLCNPPRNAPCSDPSFQAQHTPQPEHISLPQHKWRRCAPLGAEARLTFEASDVLADSRRNYCFRPFSHENILQSKKPSTMPATTSRLRLRPTSRKGIVHQYGVVQQQRIDRVPENGRDRFIQLSHRKASENRQAQERQRDSEGSCMVFGLTGCSESGLEYSQGMADMLMDLFDDPNLPPEAELQSFARPLSL